MLKNNYKYRFTILAAFICFFSISLIYPQNKQNKITDRLSEKISLLEDNKTELVWIYFTDKGESLKKYFEKPSLAVSPKSLARRAKYYKAKPLIDETDIPVNEDYIKQLIKLGIKIKHKTKWFNAVSAFVKKGTFNKIPELKFVKSIDLVAKFKVNREIEKPKEINSLPPSLLKNNSTNVFNYGFSATALNQINVPALHNEALTGAGITICIMDAGFSNLSHEVFNGMHIIDKWDFVFNDSNVGNEPLPDSGEGSHGTYTLSIIGGFKDGTLIGPAFGANYLLARTEKANSNPQLDTESPVEEDNWVAAAEWADSLGADITSTSLGYYTFDTQFSSYNHSWQDMDGNTTVITKAADLLASKGVVVVNSVGNDRSRGTTNTLVAPADGDSVIAVGAVNADGTFAVFSSYGPTAGSNARIKPDVMAPGVGIFFASGIPGNNTGYSNGQGTSFSCPLTAGVAALILQKNPSWSPIQIREALRMTASRANNPDNDYGWGIINAFNASNYTPTSIYDDEEVIPEDFALNQNYPNPFNPTTRIRYHVKNAGFVTLKVFNVLGNQVALLVNQEKPAGTYEVQFNAEADGLSLPSGVYFYRLTIGDFVATKKMILAK